MNNRDLAILEKLEKELSLKELQIKSLLTITQAINDNVPADGLYNMYQNFLSWDMGITTMALFIKCEVHHFDCVSQINFKRKNTNKLVLELLKYDRLHTVKSDDNEILQEFDIIIPVYHKTEPIAYSLIGGIKSREDLYNKIQFITTITNIIAVAIENKRLFNRKLEQEKLNKEIELARDVQKMLIPESLPQYEHFQLSSIYKPHSNIGGDYLDYIEFNKNKFAFCIADISGKGVPAALLMANFQALIQNLIYQYRDLETFVYALNQAVYRITKSDKFITFFIAQIDTKKRTMTYVNAGHYPPLLVANNKVRKLESGCTVIGAFEKLPEIKEETLTLEENSVILSFTDGLADLRNQNGEFFEDHMIESFVLKHASKDVDTFNDELLKEIDGFKGETTYVDDIAVLTCKIK
jgi:sigma-B regulation protein RsbU (phosphoserine phosphatase)